MLSAALLLAALLAGCAAEQLHRQGLKSIEQGNYEQGVQELADALRPELASRAELALAAEELANLPGDVYWIFAKGRTRPDEPLWGIQITDKTGIVLALVEGEHPVDTVRHAASLLTRD